MIELTLEQRLARSENGSAIIQDFEQQHSFELPTPWRETVQVMLLQGLEDHQLHRIFDTIMRVEYEAGRLAERPAPTAPDRQ